MVRIFAHIISMIMHPLFIIGYVLLFLILANPYIFGFSGTKSQGLVLISIFTISIMFPLIAIIMMKALGLITSLNMPDKNERIGPLIITGLFYMWLYVNVRNNDNIPSALTFFILGMTIAVFLALIINSFTKISLHTIAAGGFSTGMLFLVYNWTYGYVSIPLHFVDFQLNLSDRMVMLIVILFSGGIGTARLYLKAHNEQEIYGGYVVGLLSQIIAYRIFF